MLLMLATLLAMPATAQTDTATGRVTDAATGAPVVGANVRPDGAAGRGAATDADGRFRFPREARDAALVVSAVGYETARVPLPDGLVPVEVALQPATSALDVVTVDGARGVAAEPSAPRHALATTEDLLARLQGVSLVQRGAFAAEPVVRGYSGGQIALLVDGMPVVGACVDKMDPASSYIEPENLESVTVTRGAADLSVGSQVGGAVAFATERPRFGVPVAASVETGVESQGAARRARASANVSHGAVAVRASGSYRAADDYAAGGGETVATSGYNKRNGALAASLRLPGGGTLMAQGLADDAWLVGYPSLWMDATLASARVAALVYTGPAPHTDGVEARLYRTSVRHAMDDRFRDVRARPVMRGMYMPMAGTTTTWGARAEGAHTHGGTHVGLVADVHRTAQFGDMWMYSVYPGIQDMYLLNVGDAHALNGSLAADARRALSRRWTAAASARLDATTRGVDRADMRDLFRRRYGLAADDDLSRSRLVPSVSASLTYAVMPATRLRVSLAEAGRLPTLVEQYGHYVFNYTDGYFYTGRPDLPTERSAQLEVGVAHASRWLAVEATAFGHLLRNVVVGVADPTTTAGAPGSTYRFRLTSAAARATLVGGEASARLDLGAVGVPGLDVAATLNVVYGHNAELHEALPMLPPTGGMVAVRYRRGAFAGEAETRWAMPQNHVAATFAGELPTDGFAVAALRGTWRPSAAVALSGGVENLFDVRYAEHLTLADVPSRGRSLFLTLSLTR